MGSGNGFVPAAAPPFAAYAAQMLKQRLERMLSHAEGVRHGEANEPVHQMRVWARRTRAAIEIYGIVAHGKPLTEIEQEVKRVATALGEARDLDVMIESMTKHCADLPENQRAGVEAFIGSLREQRADCQTTVSRAVIRIQRLDLSDMLNKIIEPEFPVHENEQRCVEQVT